MEQRVPPQVLDERERLPAHLTLVGLLLGVSQLVLDKVLLSHGLETAARVRALHRLASVQTLETNREFFKIVYQKNDPNLLLYFT